MTTNIQQGTLLDVLKKKMRQTKEEMEKYKDECEEFQKRLQGEVIRREEVSPNITILLPHWFSPFCCLAGFLVIRCISMRFADKLLHSYLIHSPICKAA